MKRLAWRFRLPSIALMLGVAVAVPSTAVAATGAEAVATVAAFPGVPEDVRFVAVTADHVDLSFVDMSTAELRFEVEYKPLGTTTWNVVRTIRDQRTGQPQATGVRLRAGGLPHTAVGGCYKVYAVGSGGRVGTAQKCTAEVPHAMAMARMLSWTQTSESSYDGWAFGLGHQSLYEEFHFDWSTDFCTSSPDQPSGFDFRMPCRRHDFGYRNYADLDAFDANKSRVDSAFLADMLRKCEEYFIAVRPVCNSLAVTYYEAVSIFGLTAVSPADLAYHERWRAQLEADAAR
jgi:hypothetical protein